MLRFAAFLLTASLLAAASPFAGRWNFTIKTPNATRAIWLGITPAGNSYDVWFQPTGGHVYRLEQVAVEGGKLLFNLNRANAKGPRQTIELTRSGDTLTGVWRRGDNETTLTGKPAPEFNQPPPKAWSSPEPLFNGKDLTGWEPIGNPANSHWIVENGYLVNQSKGANLKSTRTFQDFKLRFEVNYPDHANSGFYLRGRYEIQLESEPLTANPPERRIGSVYGRIAPKGDLPRNPGTWETFEITLIGRTLTVVRNGVTTIDRQDIEGPTGGALDAEEDQPGPFYIQGDHTGGIKFRNITVQAPQP
jgi:hypothetical protein